MRVWNAQHSRPQQRDIGPVTRDTVLEGISDGVIIVDSQNRVTDFNPAVQPIIGPHASQTIGRSIARVLTAFPDLVARCYETAVSHTEIVVAEGNAQRHFDTRISPLRDQHGRLIGRLIVFRDITERRRAEVQTQQELRKHNLLLEAITAMSSTLDLPAVLRHIAEQMGQAADATSAYICSFDPQTLTSIVLAEYYSPYANEQERVSDLGVTYEEDRECLKKLEPTQFDIDYVDDPDLSEDRRAHMQAYGARTALAIPLRSGDEVIGFVELWDSRHPRDFTLKEITLCQAIAQHAAVAIKNARLFEQTQQELGERRRAEEALRKLIEELENRIEKRTTELTRTNANLAREIDEHKRTEAELLQRNRELLSLQSATAATVSSLDLPFVLQTVTWEMVNLLAADDCTISEWHAETDTLSVIAEYVSSRGTEQDVSAATYELSNYPVKKRALMERCAQQITYSRAESDTGEYADMKQAGVKTIVMVPMVFQSRVMGLVELKDSRIERYFTDHEISLAQFLTNQTAVAMENARFYAKVQRGLREQTALREAGAAILSALDPKTVLTRIAEQMGQAIDATSAYICSFEPELKLATVLAEYIGPEACPQEQISDVGASYLDDAVEFLETMRAGQHDASHVDGPNASASDRAHMQQYGAKSILYIPLLVREELIGFVELWESRRCREFTSQEIALCHGIAQQAAIALENARLYERAQEEIAERRRAEEQTRASLKEKEVLLQEIHHRVKNNLQVVSSLLNLQSNYVQDEAALEMFKESQNRILSMALIHEKLYRSQDLARIDLAEYIQTLASDLVSSYRGRLGHINLEVDATDVFLSVEKAVPCGLILNELVSNALKHAFPEHADSATDRRNGKGNKVRIELSLGREHQVELVVRDNGVGLPQDLDVELVDSLGLRLVNTLVNQLDGTINARNNDGAEFELRFAA